MMRMSHHPEVIEMQERLRSDEQFRLLYLRLLRGFRPGIIRRRIRATRYRLELVIHRQEDLAVSFMVIGAGAIMSALDHPLFGAGLVVLGMLHCWSAEVGGRRR